jgi:acetyltransferase-like isoleucine patch superfamily enzyme
MIVTNRKTEIGPRARITYHATVMSGVRVEEHGLLGSMGVATKDVPAYSVAVGIPARPVRVKSIALQQPALVAPNGYALAAEVRSG